MSSLQNTNPSKWHGFTLVELLAALAVVGVVATLALPRYRAQVARARQAEAATNLITIRDLQKTYYYEGDRGHYHSGLHYGINKCGNSDAEGGNELGFKMPDCTKSRYRYITNAGNDCAKSDGSLDQGQIYPGCTANDEWHMNSTGKLTNTHDVIKSCPGGGSSPASTCVAVALPPPPSPPAPTPPSPPAPTPPSPPAPTPPSPPAPTPPSPPAPTPPSPPAPTPPSPPAPTPPSPPAPTPPSPPAPTPNPPSCSICICDGEYVVKGYDTSGNVSCSKQSAHQPSPCDTSLTSLPACTQSLMSNNSCGGYWYQLPCAPDSTRVTCTCASSTVGDLCERSSISDADRDLPGNEDVEATNSTCGCGMGIDSFITDTNNDGTIDSNEKYQQSEKTCIDQNGDASDAGFSYSYWCPTYYNPQTRRTQKTIAACEWSASDNPKSSVGSCSCTVVFTLE